MAKILLAEDEMLVRELAFEDLSDAGHTVTAVGNGDEALSVLAGERDFEILFTDIRMPGSVDGWELAAKACEIIPELKVVYATGLNDARDGSAPDGRVLTKPYRRDDLLAAVG